MPRFAANLSTMFTELDFLERFRAAANCGFPAVEFQFPYQWRVGEIAEQLFANGLELVLFNVPPGDLAAGERGLGAVPGREEDFRDGVRRSLDYAESLRCSRLHLMAGMLGAGDDATAAHACFVENLRWAAAACAGHGVRALIEPINSRHDIPGYFLDTIDQARAITDEVASDNLFLQFDFYHRQIMGGDLAAAFAAALPLIDHIQIAGVPGRHEPDNGEINYPYLFNLIDSLGYRGWIGCEYSPAGATRDGLAWAFDYGISGHGGG